METIKLRVKQNNQPNKKVACSPNSLQVLVTPPDKVKPQWQKSSGKLIGKCSLNASIASTDVGYSSTVEYKFRVPSSLKTFQFSIGNSSDLVGISGSNGYESFANSGRCFIESPVFKLKKIHPGQVNLNSYGVNVKLYKGSFPECK